MDAGKKTHQYGWELYWKWIFINSYLKMPPAWVIRDSGNDKKYLKQQAQFLLNLDRKNNPLKVLVKKDWRFRDQYPIVNPLCIFDFDNLVCAIIKKGYYGNESGYVVAAEDDETLVAICKQMEL